MNVANYNFTSPPSNHQMVSYTVESFSKYLHKIIVKLFGESLILKIFFFFNDVCVISVAGAEF